MSTTDIRSTVPDALDLSVVVVVLASRECLRRCLGALSRQQGVGAFEIVVPFDDGLERTKELEAEFPAVRFLHVPGRRSYAQLRAAGFRETCGAIVALTEDHCSPEPDWCAQILAAHADSVVVAVGGPVDKVGPDTMLNWAVYLNDFSRYMSPVAAGRSEYLTDCNVSYKRSALGGIAALWRDEFHETIVNWTLASRGGLLVLSPLVIVKQQRSLRPGPALRERFAFGRLFASTRVATTTTPRRVAYAGLSLALLVLLPGRVASNVFRKRRHVTQFVRAAPALLALTTVWAIGELVGYITGSAGQIVRQEQLSRSAS